MNKCCLWVTHTYKGEQKIAPQPGASLPKCSWGRNTYIFPAENLTNGTRLEGIAIALFGWQLVIPQGATGEGNSELATTNCESLLLAGTTMYQHQTGQLAQK